MAIAQDILIASKDRLEIGYLNLSKNLDMELSDTAKDSAGASKNNDFDLTLNLNDWEKSGFGDEFLIYIPGTEFGGFAENRDIDTEVNTITFSGRTWRGMLSKKIIIPPAGLAYKTVSGECNSVIASVLGTELSPLFTVSTENSGLTVNYQFDRYTDMLTGFYKMLKSVDAKLKIVFDRQSMSVELSAVPIVDYSNIEDYESGVNFSIAQTKNGANHVIALGSGDLTARTVIHRYLQADGTIGTTQYYTGIEEIVETFDYPNAEDNDQLVKYADERFLEIMNKQSFRISTENTQAEIGDIIGGRERISGIVAKQPIVGKILKIVGTTENIQQKVEG
jgi:hypothetical protein